MACPSLAAVAVVRLRVVLRRPVWIALALTASTSCGDGSEVPRATETTTTSPDPTGSTVVAEEASFVLTITNQSFKEPSVPIEIRIDGQRLVEGTFAVEGQHNFYAFPFDLAPGEHSLTAKASSGEEHTEAFVLPEGEVRYGVLSFWGSTWGAEGPGPFQWTFLDTPPGFA